MNRSRLGLAMFLLSSLAAGNALAADIYVQDFESNTDGVSGAGFVSATSGFGPLGFGNQMFRNSEQGNPAAGTLVSFNLATATSPLLLDFDLAVIDSWDGNSNLGGCCNTDLLTVTVDGKEVFSADFNNVWSFVPAFGFNLSSDTQTFPRDGRMIAGPTANLGGEWIGDLGFDSAYRLSVDLGLLAPGDHVIAFYAGGPGWQGGSDESFAIDNLRVHATPVPLPPALLLMGFGLGGLGLGARRRTRRS